MKGMVIDPEYVKQLGREMEATVLANLTTEKLLAKVSPEQLLATLSPEQRLEGLEPEVVLSHYAPEQRLEDLDLAVIETYLQQHKQTAEASTTHKKPAARRKPKPKSDI